jgi:hypothetical protein
VWLTTMLIPAPALAVEALAPTRDFNLCYFTMNNTAEFPKLKSFVEKLDAQHRIKVIEFHSPGAAHRDAFRDMVDSGTRCDGLVLSGHHTGSWTGGNGRGKLELELIDSLACVPSPVRRAFFDHVNALWLQGCRSMGIEAIQPGFEAFEPNRADFHTWRVAAHSGSSLPQSMENFNLEFSSTLDQDNPLGERLPRSFPRATVFGWQASAPGETTGSENGLPLFISMAGRMADDRAGIFDDAEDPVSPESSAAYAYIISQILSPGPKGQPKVCEREAIAAWKEHGYYQHSVGLMASLSLQSQDRPDQWKTRARDCALKFSEDLAGAQKSLKEVLSDEKAIAYSFNSITAYVKRLRESGQSKLLKTTLKRLADSGKLKSFMERKLQRQETGVIRRLDYYRFYQDVTGKKLPEIENAIREQAFAQLAQELPGHEAATSGYRQIILSAMLKSDVVDEAWVNRVLTLRNDPLLTVRVQAILAEIRMKRPGALAKVFPEVKGRAR